jgi:membrane-bound ClpP family serine protease
MWWIIGILIFILIGVIAAVLALIIRTYSQKTATGKEDLTGRTAIVKETLQPAGVVLVEGELWDAVSRAGTIEADQEVTILEVKSLTLIVTNKTKE